MHRVAATYNHRWHHIPEKMLLGQHDRSPCFSQAQHPLRAPWEQNVLAMLPMGAIALCAGEAAALRTLRWTPAGAAVLTASCAAGLGMSFFSFALRAAVSATSFSVVGNVCKVLTILVNLLLWDQHAGVPLLNPFKPYQTLTVPLPQPPALASPRSGCAPGGLRPSPPPVPSQPRSLSGCAAAGPRRACLEQAVAALPGWRRQHMGT